MSTTVLSLDGGGIRGAATARFLSLVEKELSEKHKKTIYDCVDFFAGTSTGSIIALALATARLAMEEIDDLYSHRSALRVFEENKGWFERDGFNAPKYEASGKADFLREKLGEKTTLGDVEEGKHVLAVAYAIEQREPMVIKSTKQAHRHLLSYRVADASSAAPTYFPTVPMEIPSGSDDEYWLIDGGVVANNPTMCAISEVRGKLKTEIEDIKVLSVGTGFMTRKINGPESRKWGGYQWFTEGHILDVLSDERIVAYQAMNLLKEGSYIRVNAELRKQPGLEKPPDDAMDDVSRSNIGKLRKLGTFWFEQYGTEAVELLAHGSIDRSLDRIDPDEGRPIQSNLRGACPGPKRA